VQVAHLHELLKVDISAIVLIKNGDNPPCQGVALDILILHELVNGKGAISISVKLPEPNQHPLKLLLGENRLSLELLKLRLGGSHCWLKIDTK